MMYHKSPKAWMEVEEVRSHEQKYIGQKPSLMSRLAQEPTAARYAIIVLEAPSTVGSAATRAFTALVQAHLRRAGWLADSRRPKIWPRERRPHRPRPRDRHRNPQPLTPTVRSASLQTAATLPPAIRPPIHRERRLSLPLEGANSPTRLRDRNHRHVPCQPRARVFAPPKCFQGALGLDVGACLQAARQPHAGHAA